MSAAPLAVSRTLSPQGFRGRLMRAMSSQAITGELANLPAETLPLLRIVALLTLLYLLILGPANFLVLHRLKRDNLSWITVPCLALSYVALLFGMSTHLKGSSVVLNSIGLITLDDRPGLHPATVYVGLAAPLPGDYHLTYSASALPGTIAQLDDFDRMSFRSASTLSNGPLGVRLQEGTHTDVTLLAMKQWSTRDVVFKTTVNVPGRVQSDLVLNKHGTLVGSIHNGTNLDILHPIVVAGQNVTPLPDIRAGSTVRARVQPNSDVEIDQTSIWTALFSRDTSSYDRGFGMFGGFGDCCNQSQFPEEKSLSTRIQNAAGMLSQVHALSSLGEVVMVGWSLRPLASFTVNGGTPQQRTLNMVVIPVHVQFPSRGPFHLRPGTLGATLVDIAPRATRSDCCSFFSAPEQQVSLGVGGSMTFEFDTPNAPHVRFRQVQVTINSNDTGINRGEVYNWDIHRWMTLDLTTGFAWISRAHRIVSPTGKILVRFRATDISGDITMDNPYEDVQISGSGSVT
jgi:hypothetical protein